jgi:hypothetical protein
MQNEQFFKANIQGIFLEKKLSGVLQIDNNLHDTVSTTLKQIYSISSISGLSMAAVAGALSHMD